MNDQDLATLCIFEEAGNQPHEGRVAVGIVILNRIKSLYQSDGTMPGTVFHGNGVAFSWVGFAMVDGHYTRVASGPDEIEARAERLLTQAQTTTVWTDCGQAWQDACLWWTAKDGQQSLPMSFVPGPAFAGLTTDTVLYLNPKISSAAWATPDKEDAVIFDHTFFHA